jgi:hypothetical protein
MITLLLHLLGSSLFISGSSSVAEALPRERTSHVRLAGGSPRKSSTFMADWPWDLGPAAGGRARKLNVKRETRTAFRVAGR